MTAVGAIASYGMLTFIASPRKNILSVDLNQKKYGHPWYSIHNRFQ